MLDWCPLISFGVVVESKKTQNAFLVESPWKQDAVNNVPWVVGMTKDEGDLVATSERQ